MRRFLFACGFGAFVLSVGCFGRTGIGLEELESAGALEDAEVDSGVTIVEAGSDGSVVEDTAVPKPDTAGEDRWIDIWDVIPIPDSGVIGECASCVRDKCGSQVNACINSPACRSGLACVATKCLAGGGGGGGTGGIDFACVTGCFGGDFKTASLAISTFTCVISGCGAKCGGFLGGTGLPGSGGGTPGFPGSGAKFEMPSDPEKMDPGISYHFSIEAFSPWRKELDQSACEQGLASCPQ